MRILRVIPRLIPKIIKNRVPTEFRLIYRNVAQLHENYSSNATISHKEISNILNSLEEEFDVPKITFLDIGARKGTHLNSPILKSNISVRYIGIEPEEEECENLSGKYPEREFYSKAIGNGKKTNLNLTKHKGCASLLEPNEELLKKFKFKQGWFEKEKSIEINTIKLDKFIENKKISPDIVKCDTQGYEYEIFKHGKKTIENALFIEFETQFQELYKQQKRFSEIDIFLRKHNYEFIDFKESNNWNSKSSINKISSTNEIKYNSQIIEADVLYHQKICQNPSFEQILKITVFLINYGKIDAAKYILREEESVKMDKIAERIEEIRQ